MLDDRAWGKVREEMRRQLLEIFPPQRDACDRILYHYTGPAGAIGILESGTIWLTHFRYLNDPREILAGQLYAQGILDSVCESKVSTPSEKTFAGIAADAYRRVQLSEFDFFVASFCERGDDLSQWRAYGQDGAGYSIGFRFNTVDLMNDPSGCVPERDVVLVRCSYDEEEDRDVLVEDVRKHCAVFDKYSNNYADQRPDVNIATDELYRDCCGIMVGALNNRALRYKSKYYDSEREWRVYQSRSVDQRGVKFRANSVGIVPYVEVSVVNCDATSRVQEIYVGPAGNIGLRKRALGRLLTERSITCDLKMSSIAYRG